MPMRYLVLILASFLLMGCSSSSPESRTEVPPDPEGDATYAEYRNNFAALQINALGAYQLGDTGEGQTIAVYGSWAENIGYDPEYNGLKDSDGNSIFVDGHMAAGGGNTDVGVCKIASCRNDHTVSHPYNIMAGRKDDIGAHGVAYDAKIKLINRFSHPTDTNKQPSVTELRDAILQGGGENMAAMVIEDSSIADRVAATNGSVHYWGPPLAMTTDASQIIALKTVTDTTVLISATGKNSLNSVNGLVDTWSSEADLNSGTVEAVKNTASTLYGSAAAANIAAYSDNITDADFAGKWIAVVGVYGDKILEDNNGCGSVARYCLAVPDARTESNSSGQHLVTGPEYILGGAIAVLRSAYPNLSVEQIVTLTLGTANYIQDATGVVDIDSDGNPDYNAVYGHGLLNLYNATTLTLDDALPADIISCDITDSANVSDNPFEPDNSIILCQPRNMGASWGETQLTLSSHFGSQLNSVNLGVQDKYGRHFVLEAQNIAHENVAIGLDDYMAGLLGDNVQSERLGAQAQANYSNTGEQNWMNLEYISGKSTTKLAFQDSYKVNPLNDMGESFSLRANHIRPASNNIGMMDVDYALTQNLTLSSYAARGEYDTGYKFDELGTDIDLRYNKSTLNLGLGHLREHEQFLGTNTTGAYALREPAISQFTDVTYGHDVGEKFNIYANYIQYKTDVNMGYQDFADIDGLQADQYQIGFKGKNILSDDDGLNVALITKLGVTDGALTQNTVMGYTQAGGFNNVTQSYDLAVSERHQQFEITYQGKLYQNADKVSALQDNRFFTTIRVDQNLNHEAGLGQTEVIGGINARF